MNANEVAIFHGVRGVRVNECNVIGMVILIGHCGYLLVYLFAG